MDRGASEDVPVLVVGGSLVGLSAALFLRRHGVDVLAVERHAGTAINARAGHFHLRTVGILRSAELEDAVRRKSEEQYPPDGGINNVESLAGREIANYFPNLNAEVDEFSPTVRLFINQDALEPILRARAIELGARLRYRTESTSLEQDADGVTAVIRDLESGTESSVRAKYVVAADGNRSPVRERLGIGMHGHGLLSHSITIYFRALADFGPLLMAGPGLLDSYDAERRRVGELTVEHAFTRYVTRVAPYPGTENTHPIVDDFSMEIGYCYDSAAVVLEPGGPPLHEHPRESAGRPGARAPHVFLDRDGTRPSRLDLFGWNFVLLAGPEGAAWPAAAPAVAGRLGVGLDAHVVVGTGLADPEGPSRGRTGSRGPGPSWCDRTASWAGGPPKRPAHPPRLSGRRSRRCCAGKTASHELRVRKAKEGPLMAHVYRADTVGSLLRPQYLKLAREQFEAGQMTAAAYKEIEDRAVDQAIAMQEAVGLDVVTDGELRRHTFIDQLTEQVEGLTLDPVDGDHVPVPFHDASGTLKSVFTIPLSVTSKLRRRRMMTVEEYSYARAKARRPVKVTLPSPLMLFLVWSPQRSRDAYRDPFELFADGLRLMREEAEELARLGCRYIQVDAPDFGQLVDQTQRDAWERAGISVDRVFSEGADLLNKVAGIPGVTFGLHLCRGNYDSDWISSGTYETISKQLFRRAANYDVFLLEYDDERSGSFSALSDVPDDKVVVLGMVSSKFGTMEPADQLTARIREASGFFPREQLALSTQCGFASAGPGNAISEDAQENKLRLVAEVANRVWPTGG